jgi:hypothetical protein
VQKRWPRYFKGKLEIFGFGVFTQIRPVWVGDRGTRSKIHNFDALGLKIAVLYFLALKIFLTGGNSKGIGSLNSTFENACFKK